MEIKPDSICRKFLVVNVQDGRFDVPCYIDCEQISEWHEWKTGMDLPQGVHRNLRDKTLIVINMKTGGMHWCQESFDAVSARILEARQQGTLAEIHRAAQAASEAAAITSRKSPLAV